jgi:hypothetical protein
MAFEVQITERIIHTHFKPAVSRSRLFYFRALGLIPRKKGAHTLTLTCLTGSSTVPQGATADPSPSESSSESTGCIG